MKKDNSEEISNNKESIAAKISQHLKERIKDKSGRIDDDNLSQTSKPLTMQAMEDINLEDDLSDTKSVGA